MKVLFATYPMAFHTPGGGEVQLRAYEKHLPAHGVDVMLLDQWAPRFLDHDVVHFFSSIGGSVHFCHFVKQLGLPLVVSSSLWITESTRHLYPTDEIRAQMSLADQVVTNSNIESNTLARVFNLPREKFVAVYNGIDELFFNDSTPVLFRQTFGIDGCFVLNVGNIEPRKNQLMLVRAIKAFPDVRLVLIGHKRDSKYAEQVLFEGGDQVMYLGALSHGEMLLSAYRACELFCLPSTLETPGLAALEAAAQGARLLVTSEGSCAEYFGNRAAYLDPASLESIRNGIGTMLAAGNTDGTAAGSTFRPSLFTWEQTTMVLSNVYHKLI